MSTAPQPDTPLNFTEDFPATTDHAWRALVEKTLHGKPFDKVMKARSYDGIEIEALYTKANARIEPQAAIRSGDWCVASPFWNSDASAMNAEILEDLERGVEALAIQLEAGSIPGLKLQDLSVALEGVYLNMARFYLMPGEEYEAGAEAMLALLDKAEKAAGSPQGEAFYGNLGCDPIGTLAKTGRLKEKAELALEKSAAIAREKPRTWQHVTTFRADASHYHLAGATEAQELACMLATVVEYMRAMNTHDGSVLPDEIEPVLAADADIFLGIAKFRAASRLLSRVQEAFAVESNPQIHAVTSLRMMTVKDPWVNILRGTAAAFAAGVGGASSVSVLPHDTLHGLSGKSARRIARNIQIMLQEESNVSGPQDPAGGSFAIESLTSSLCNKAWKIFQKIETDGGMLAALRSGYIHSMIDASWKQRKVNIAKRKDPITGVSEFPDIHEKPPEGASPVFATPNDVEPAGEEITPLPFHRLAEEFEAFRFRSDEQLAKKGKRPLVFVAGLGRVADFTARATFAKSFFEAGGIEALTNDGFADIAALKAAFEGCGATIAVVCGTDSQYEDIGIEAAKQLKACGATRVYLAGRPKNADALVNAGVDEFIYMGADVLAMLETAYEVLGDAS